MASDAADAERTWTELAESKASEIIEEGTAFDYSLQQNNL